MEEKYKEFIAKQAKVSKKRMIASAIIGLPAWTYLFVINWKLGIVVFLIIWANNLRK
jgi:hypothetical protein